MFTREERIVREGSQHLIKKVGFELDRKEF